VHPGVVELQETINTIREWHLGEGFLHVEENPTMYSRDRRLSELKSLMVTWLLLYQDGDYGIISNEQRQQRVFSIAPCII
jgi:hypothetical protein